MNFKTWADGVEVTTAEFNTELVDNLDRLISPPIIHRTFASNTTAVASGSWALATLDNPAQGEGRYASLDTTIGAFGSSATAITVPEDGLYEVAFSAVIHTAVSGTTLTYGAAAVAINQSTAALVSQHPLCRIALNQAWSEERAGNGLVTVNLSAGNYLSIAVYGSGTTWVTGKDSYTQMDSFLSVCRVGEKI